MTLAILGSGLESDKLIFYGAPVSKTSSAVAWHPYAGGHVGDAGSQKRDAGVPCSQHSGTVTCDKVRAERAEGNGSPPMVS